MRIVLAYPTRAAPVDGIRDYARRVAEQFSQQGDDATLLRPRRGVTLPLAMTRMLPRACRCALVVEYNPFAWGRWGVAPSLPIALTCVRLLRPHVRIVLAIHEAYVPMRNLRSALLGGWQRAQIRILLALSHDAIAMTGDLTQKLSHGWPHRVITHVPVGSNLPDERTARSAARSSCGI